MLKIASDFACASLFSLPRDTGNYVLRTVSAGHVYVSRATTEFPACRGLNILQTVGTGGALNSEVMVHIERQSRLFSGKV